MLIALGLVLLLSLFLPTWALRLHHEDSTSFPDDWKKRFSQEELEMSAQEAEKWRVMSRNAFIHTWNGYKRTAWGSDELRPVSGGPGRELGHCAMTMVEALSTMWIMDLKDDFWNATAWINSNLHLESEQSVSFFETTIRILGGLASAHSLSGSAVFLRKAKTLAQRMLRAFSPESGFPTALVRMNDGAGSKDWYDGTILADAGSIQLEFRYLAQQTGNQEFAQKVDKSMRSILHASGGKGLLPWGLSSDSTPRLKNDEITMGGMADSFYEYLLKMYVQTSRTEPEWKDAWKKAMQEMKHRLIRRTKGGLTYIAQEHRGLQDDKMEQFTCFAGGMLVYGARNLRANEVDPDWERLAGEITETCYQMYQRQPSQLAPECVHFEPNGAPLQDMLHCESDQGLQEHLLRPETAESIFYMFYYTGDPKYRRMAGAIMEAIERHTKSTYGYSAVKNVRYQYPQKKDEMNSFFVAETLKYLYLTFLPNPREVLDLEKFVFNTEGHPLKIQKI